MELVRGDKRQQRGVEIWDYFKVKGALKKGSILVLLQGEENNREGLKYKFNQRY